MKTKIWKKLISLTMVICLFTILGACSSSETKEPAKTTDSTEAIVDEKAEVAEKTESSTGEKHPCRIVQPGTFPTDYETGIAAVNKKLEEDGIDIEVEVIRIPWDAYAEKLNLMLSSGEEFEILHIMQDVRNVSSIAGVGAITPVTEYIDKYPNLKARFTDMEWASTLYKGEYYAIPDAWRGFDNVMAYLTYREDIMNQVGYKEFPETVDEIIDLMKKSQDAILEENGMMSYHWMHQNQDTAHWLHRSYDTYPFYVENSMGLVLARQDGTIDSFYESEEFKKDCEFYAKIYQEGLINPDILNLDSQAKYDDANYGAFLPSNTFDANVQNSIKQNTGMDRPVNWTRAFSDKPDMIYTYGQNMNAVSSTAEDPETAFKFFDWLYTSQENYDLFHYGVEGVHYTLNDEGRITNVKGEDGNNLYTLDTWMTGYVPYTRYTEDAQEAYIEYDQYKSNNYVISPIAGFAFDSANVQSELTNLQTEIISSIYPIKFGMVSYEDNIDAAIKKLKAAGLDTYMEEYRKQVAEYLKANPQALEGANGNQ
jgi:putative aldouronate transport system substrate-binding protein